MRRRTASAVLGRLVGVTAVSLALTALVVLPVQADPYPPTPPCTLSFSAAATTQTTATPTTAESTTATPTTAGTTAAAATPTAADSTAVAAAPTAADSLAAAATPTSPDSTTAAAPTPTTAASTAAPPITATLTGSGLGSEQTVQVVLYPQRTTLGSWVTDDAGSFQAQVALPEAAADQPGWVTATTALDSCWTPRPTAFLVGPSAVATGSTGSTSSAGPTGSSAGGSAGSGPSNSGGATGSSRPGAGGTGTTASRTSTNPRSSSSGSQPDSAAQSAPTATRSSVLNGQPPLNRGLPTSVILTIAVLLLLAGGLAVIFLTRRAG